MEFEQKYIFFPLVFLAYVLVLPIHYIYVMDQTKRREIFVAWMAFLLKRRQTTVWPTGQHRGGIEWTYPGWSPEFTPPLWRKITPLPL